MAADRQIYVHTHMRNAVTLVWGKLASYPGSQWAGKETAWYPLFAQKSW